MPSLRKAIFPGQLYFVTASTQQGLLFAQFKGMGNIFRRIMARAQTMYPVTICGYVIMGNHLHMLLIPQDMFCFTQFMGYLKQEVAHVINRKRAYKQLTVWCEGYDSAMLLTAEDALHYFSYMYNNPVKARLVSSIEEFHHSLSSWHEFSSGNLVTEYRRLKRTDFGPGGFTMTAEDRKRVNRARNASSRNKSTHTRNRLNVGLTPQKESRTTCFFSSDTRKGNQNSSASTATEHSDEHEKKEEEKYSLILSPYAWASCVFWGPEFAAIKKDFKGPALEAMLKALITSTVERQGRELCKSLGGPLPKEAIDAYLKKYGESHVRQKHGAKLWVICSNRTLRIRAIKILKAMCTIAKEIFAKTRFPDVLHTAKQVTTAHFPFGFFPPTYPPPTNPLPGLMLALLQIV